MCDKYEVQSLKTFAYVTVLPFASFLSLPLYSAYLRSKWAIAWQNQQMTCAPSKDSDQPRHLPSLIRVFAVRMKKAWVLSYPLSTQRRPSRCPGWSESSLGAQSFCWFCHAAAQIKMGKSKQDFMQLWVFCSENTLMIYTLQFIKKTHKKQCWGEVGWGGTVGLVSGVCVGDLV